MTIFSQVSNSNSSGVAESGDDFTKFSTISQWFQRLIHPPLMQRHSSLSQSPYNLIFIFV
ncbi:MAG: hypothetical protein HRU34_05240 [Richelia sp.]|nr:hypothetical protein [Richelia sp.]CDN12448.1 hypothetical protein RintRC_1131 [Richelia intracellularis]